MTAPLLDAQGTWDEIAARATNLHGRRLRVIVLPADDAAGTPDTRPIADVMAGIASTLTDADLQAIPADFTDRLDHYVYTPDEQ